MLTAAVIVVCLIAAVAWSSARLRLTVWSAAWLLGVGLLISTPARAIDADNTATVDLPTLKVSRTEDGILLDFAVRFDMPHGIEEGLNKGVPLYFVAEADLFQPRWYWRDKAIAHASRTWRLAYQPLTRGWRVSIGGLDQHFTTLSEALSAITRSYRWKIADPLPAGEHGVYVEFSYKLDTSQLPRPLQIGLGGEVEWALEVQRNVPVPDSVGH